jgi:hypothetical protein
MGHTDRSMTHVMSRCELWDHQPNLAEVELTKSQVRKLRREMKLLAHHYRTVSLDRKPMICISHILIFFTFSNI